MLGAIMAHLPQNLAEPPILPNARTDSGHVTLCLPCHLWGFQLWPWDRRRTAWRPCLMPHSHSCGSVGHQHPSGPRSLFRTLRSLIRLGSLQHVGMVESYLGAPKVHGIGLVASVYVTAPSCFLLCIPLEGTKSVM